MNKTGWLYCAECPQYSIRLEGLGYLCDCLSWLLSWLVAPLAEKYKGNESAVGIS